MSQIEQAKMPAKVPGNANGKADQPSLSDHLKKALAAEKTAASQTISALTGSAHENTLAPNPLVGFSARDVQESLTKLFGASARKPAAVAARMAALGVEGLNILAGRSTLAPRQGDKRFMDPAWFTSPLHKRVMQNYLAMCREMDRLVDDLEFNRKDAARIRFVLLLFMDALAPTNTLFNPMALKQMINSSGLSPLLGARNLIRDLSAGEFPRQVDGSKFALGKNLATTEGQVVYRTEMFEIVQYQPKTKQIHERPLLCIPPQINRFYVFDLSPEKSVAKYLLEQEISLFALVWRNPRPDQGHWDMEAYVRATHEAIDAVCAISEQDSINLTASCSGGISTVGALAHMAATEQLHKVNALTLFVSVFETSFDDSLMGIFATEEGMKAAKKYSAQRKVLDGKDMARVFNWMRANDLIWNYWVNNYLMGNTPPAFDVLYWNAHTTRLAAAYHSDMIDIFHNNSLKTKKLEIMGEVIDPGKIDIDVFALGGVTDHITPWQGCYQSAGLLSGETTFVLSNSGHIQSILNPPGNPKANYFYNEQRPADAAEWLAGAENRRGSWWPFWVEWLAKRSGKKVEPRASLGSTAHPPLGPAPGTYVHE